MTGSSRPDPLDPRTELLQAVSAMQKDALLLLSFVSERKERAFGSDRAAPWTKDEFLESLRATPQELVRDTALWKALLEAVDGLASTVRPATVGSIRFTRMFVERGSYKAGYQKPGHDRDNADDRIRQGVRNLLGAYWILGFVGVAMVLATVMILIHVLSGEAVLQRIEQLSVEQAALDPMLARAAADRVGARGFLCSGSAGNVAGAASEDAEPRGRVAASMVSSQETGAADGDLRPNASSREETIRALCERQWDMKRKMAITYLQLGEWNAATERMSNVLLVPWIIRPDVQRLLDDYIAEGGGGVFMVSSAATASTVGEPSATKVSTTELRISDRSSVFADLQGAWKRTELRSRIKLDSLTSYVIPGLLGFIGACVFVFRNLHRHLEAWTLEPRELLLAATRVVLGAMLGGLVSLLFMAGGDADPGFEFSLGLLAFITGYAVQFVFDKLDGIVNRPPQLPPAA
ncbi:hypothetical protein [Arenibaculum sp.]|jgi:hypothetical protein|uniref:hypothetical protein n=1 Tax=Arenibaculum sp. TaxID=2865862 RepID=UPI002E105C77|nr:hypothetical protein [Arenibaculum sp.]